MKKISAVAVQLCLLGAAMHLAGAAPKPAPKKATAKKPVPAKPAAQRPKPVKGANQMDGENAKPGVIYTMGKAPSVNFTLNSAEYSVERVNIGESTYAPQKDEKLLVLNYSVHNPNKEEFSYDWGTLRFTVVDAQNVNHEDVQQVGDSQTRQNLNITLKPAQKINAYTVIKVPAAGPIPKLIVRYDANSTAAVLRYDLRGQVKALAAPFADPADTTGVTARTEVPAQIGTYYPAMNYDLKLVKVEYSDGPLGEISADEGKKFLVATVAVKNATSAEAYYDYGSFVPALVDSEGEEVAWGQSMLKTTRNEAATGTLKPGAEYTTRILFAVNKDVTGKTLTLSEPDSRVYSFDLTAK